MPAVPSKNGHSPVDKKPAANNRLSAADGERTKILNPYELFGCSFTISGDEAHADECPFCDGKKFSVNVTTGQYQCFNANKCGQKGNAYTFINWAYKRALGETTDEDYRRLKTVRGLSLQTLKRHGLVWSAQLGCWLIPSMSKNGDVQNLLRYWPETGIRLALPSLPLRLFGLDRLSDNLTLTLFVCEGAWDAIALDQHLRENKTRDRYDILAAPSATVFKTEWLEYLKGRTVRLCFDNDKAGRDGQQRIIKLVRDNKIQCKLSALLWPEGFPEKCDVRDLTKDGVNVVEFTRDHCQKVEAGESRLKLVRGDTIVSKPINWLWPGHLQFDTFASLSGEKGTQKSTIARDIAARCTAGLPMPNCETALAPFDVLYFTSEDDPAQVCDSVRIHKGDPTRLHVYDIADTIDPIDALDFLGEIESQAKNLGARLIIIDAVNSFVGGDISTDSKARRTVTGPLQSLARRTGACIIGVRNWGRMASGTASQKALGATSLSDVGRCTLNTAQLRPVDPTDKREAPRYQLEFERVSNAPQPQSIPYSVQNLAKCEADSHHRRIIWREPLDPVAIKAMLIASQNR